MVTHTRRMTVEEFDQFVTLPENADRLFEYIGGEVIESKLSTIGRRARWYGWWIPEHKRVEVYVPQQKAKTVGTDGALDAGDVLPGFSLAVSEIFPDES